MKTGILTAELAAKRIAAGQPVADIFGPAGARRAKLVSATGSAAAAVDAETEDRTIDFVLSTGSVDRYGDTIAPAGWQLDAYRTNPVVLFAHDDSSPPIAKASHIRVQSGALRATATFATADVYPLADTVFRLLKAGFLNAASVGFVPLKAKLSTDPARRQGLDISAAELLEWSIVTIPANPDALVQARSFGIDTHPLAEWAERALDERQTSMSRTDLLTMRASMGAPRLRGAAAVRAAAAAKLRGEFSTFGDFVKAVVEEAQGQPDSRLVRAPAGGNESSPIDGGFLVPDQWETELIESLYAEAVVAPLCDRRETSGALGTIKVPAIDETSRADGSRSGGAIAYWLSESDLATASLPRLRMIELGTHKLIALAYSTKELFRDVPLLESHLRSVFASEMSFKLDAAIIAGSGAGLPLGVLGGPATVSVAKEIGQVPKTIMAENVRNMWAVLPAPSRRRAVWLINEDAENLLELLASSAGTGSAAIFIPAGAFGNPYPLLKGRPVIAVEQCPALGSVGDIILVDLSQYILRDGGVQPAVSLDVKFDKDEVLFRFVLRVDGRPKWASSITPYNGATTKRSPYVTLAAR